MVTPASHPAASCTPSSEWQTQVFACFIECENFVFDSSMKFARENRETKMPGAGKFQSPSRSERARGPGVRLRLARARVRRLVVGMAWHRASRGCGWLATPRCIASSCIGAVAPFEMHMRQLAVRSGPMLRVAATMPDTSSEPADTPPFSGRGAASGPRRSLSCAAAATPSASLRAQRPGHPAWARARQGRRGGR